MKQTPAQAPTARTEVRRHPERGNHDPAVIRRILDEGLVCHVGFAIDGKPYVIPTGYARWGAEIVLHGSKSSRMLQALAAGCDVCLTVTLLDGLVLARSAAHHSMNYRSVVVFGRARHVTDPDEKYRALKTVVDHLVPERSGDARMPSAVEIETTEVVALSLDEASAKIRVGPPIDLEADKQLRVWAGEIPLRLVPQTPIADPELDAAIDVPDYATRYTRHPV